MAGEVLVERQRELAALGGAVTGLHDGTGVTVLIDGPAGIGKTRLLESVRDLSTRHGARFLRARGSPVEQSYSFGVLRQLLEPTLRSAAPDELSKLAAGAASMAVQALLSGDGGPTPTFGLLHGIYWLIANLAEQGPLVLAVDDAHLADEPSLSALAFAAARVEELPVALVIALRSGTSASSATLLELSRIGESRRVTPKPLSVGGVRRLAEIVASSEVSDDGVAACLEVTGGNPFLLEQLLVALAEADTPITREVVEAVSGALPDSLSHAVMLRLGSLGEDALALARALSVFGEGAELRHAAALAALGVERATAAASALTRARVLTPGEDLEFAHPLTRAAVYQDLTASERSLAHRRAAVILSEAGAPAGLVASHVLLAEPAGESWAETVLIAAGREAFGQGADAEAIELLRRALAERAEHDDLGALLATLGSAELRHGDHAVAAQHLSEALELADRAEDVVDRAVAAAGAVAASEGQAEAVAVLEQALDRLDGEREATLLVESELAYLPYFDAALADRIENRYERLSELEGRSPGERAMLASLAFRRAWTGGTAAEVSALARRALADGTLMRERGPAWIAGYFLGYILMAADELEIVEQEFRQLTAQAGEQGHLLTYVMGTTLTSRAALAAGDVVRAEADAAVSEAAARQMSVGSPLDESAWVGAGAALIEPQVYRGELVLAQAAAERVGFPDGAVAGDDLPRARHAHHRAVLRLAQGRSADALADALAARDHLSLLGIEDPVNSWRFQAVRAYLDLGRVEDARQVASEQLARAREWGSNSLVGRSMALLALCEPADRRGELLADAVGFLEDSPARLELARARGSLGVSMLRAGRKTDGQALLRQALEGASRCGATALAETLHDELRVSGARPRRLMFSGLESLTASELRVAELAASGLSNRQIAQQLFITLKTVENHLMNAYRKLDIQSRRQLPAVLEGRSAIGSGRSHAGERGAGRS
jgi:DNA-binding CsgD family transcriptional regulator